MHITKSYLQKICIIKMKQNINWLCITFIESIYFTTFLKGNKMKQAMVDLHLQQSLIVKN